MSENQIDPYLPSDFGVPQIFDPEYFNSYIASYGIALGDFNLGLTRSMQSNIHSVSTDCYQKAKISSKGIEEMFKAENYENQTYSWSGFIANFQKFQVVFMDQFFACKQYEVMNKTMVRLEPQKILMSGESKEMYVHLMAFFVKIVVCGTLLLIKPEQSGLFQSFQFLMLFVKEGGFQNLGIATGLALEYLLDYQSPDIDVPLKPFQSWEFYQK